MRYSEKHVLTITGTAPNGNPAVIVTEFDDPDEAMAMYVIKSDAIRGGFSVVLERVMTVEIVSTIKA